MNTQHVCVCFIISIEWITFVMCSDVVFSLRHSALSNWLRHGELAVTFFWNDFHYIRTEIRGIAMPNWHTAKHTWSCCRTHSRFQMLQSVALHCGQHHTGGQVGYQHVKKCLFYFVLGLMLIEIFKLVSLAVTVSFIIKWLRYNIFFTERGCGGDVTQCLWCSNICVLAATM